MVLAWPGRDVRVFRLIVAVRAAPPEGVPPGRPEELAARADGPLRRVFDGELEHLGRVVPRPGDVGVARDRVQRPARRAAPRSHRRLERRLRPALEIRLRPGTHVVRGAGGRAPERRRVHTRGGRASGDSHAAALAGENGEVVLAVLAVVLARPRRVARPGIRPGARNSLRADGERRPAVPRRRREVHVVVLPRAGLGRAVAQMRQRATVRGAHAERHTLLRT